MKKKKKPWDQLKHNKGRKKNVTHKAYFGSYTN